MTTDAVSEHWWLDALCLEVGPEIFFIDKGESARPAKRVCALCPVRAACLDDAIARDDRFGIRGGMSERERHALRRGQPIAVCKCGAEFVPRDEGQRQRRRYCSEQCRKAAHREVQRASHRRRSAA